VAPATAGPVRLQVNGGVLDLHLPSGVRQYRGHITATLSGQAAKPLYVVNTVSIDDYVRGVVAAEMPSGWHEQALRAQAVAARSYGMQPCPQPSSYPATGLYDVVDTISCQVYGGLSSETTRTNDAVTATAGQVIRYGGAIVRAEFSASSGGWTVANGGPFVAKQDPYDAVGASAARSDVHRWTGARVPLSRLESAHGTGLIREVRVLQRNGNGEWGGRVLRVRLVGDTRTVEITGEQFRSSSGLRSSWFDLVSPIDAKWVSLGGAGGLLGAPVGPEAALAGGGRFRAYERGNIYWKLEHGAFETHGAILQHYGVHRWEGGILGYPVTDELRTPDGVGRYNHFEGGSIYWTSAIGPREVHGSIREAWARNRWEAGPLGYPVTDETATPDGRGRYNHFQRGSVYWSPSTPASAVHGSIRARWQQLRWELGPLGYPRTDELPTPDGVGRYTHFEKGSVYWSPATGAWEVLGPIRDTWAALGWERSVIGYPTTGQRTAPDGTGRYNHFQRGSVYWSPGTGAHEVRGAIRDRWASLGWETGRLGYPVTDEYAVPGGRRSDFQGGSIVWEAATRTTTVI
jgi:SpoIID/LytB domain protein